MSRLSKKPIALEGGVTLSEKDGVVMIAGPKGELRLPLLPFVAVNRSEEGVRVSSDKGTKQAKMNEGTMWSLVRNAIRGVVAGFSKTLEISGTGYRAELQGGTLVLFLGFAHPVRYSPPPGVSIALQKNTVIVSGINKELVGRAAATIRAFKKPEPYKGKGIKYSDEIIIRKAGKKAAAAGGAA